MPDALGRFTFLVFLRDGYGFERGKIVRGIVSRHEYGLRVLPANIVDNPIIPAPVSTLV